MNLKTYLNRHSVTIFVFIGAIILIVSFAIFFKYILCLDWKDALQTSASIATVFGLILAWQQIKATKDIHRTQFEDSLDNQYRELIYRFPIEYLLGELYPNKNVKLRKDENIVSLVYQYVDLTNEQISLYNNNRISKETWENWKKGIEANMSLPVIKEIWLSEINPKTDGNFKEFRNFFDNQTDKNST